MARPKKYVGEYLTGIELPVGGIGTSSIFVDGRGPAQLKINGRRVRAETTVTHNQVRLRLPVPIFIQNGQKADVLIQIQ